MGNTLNASKYDNLYFMGDIHFGPIQAANVIINKGIENAAVIICGDFGIGFERGKLSEEREICYLFTVNSWLRKRNIHLYVIRGNHDDPYYFNSSMQLFEQKYSNIDLLPDYTIIKYKKERILCVGGAVSLDRSIRTQEINYWDNEKPVYDLKEIGKKLISGKITILATHDMPSDIYDESEFGKDLLGYKNRDLSLEADVEDSRNRISKVLNRLIKRNSKPSKVYYGHYHRSKTERWNDIEFNGLDICELKKY